MRSLALTLASLATAFVQAASAQEIPGRVGRLAYTQGPVSVYQDPEFGWDKAYVNTPITSENSVWTDRGARAEMRVGGTAVRLDGETQVDVSRLDDDVLDATIQRGSVNVRVRYKERHDQLTFATPNALFNLETDGRYRIDVDEERDESRLTVFGGYAFLDGSSGRIPVEPGRTVIVSGGGQYDFIRAGETAFDRWAAVRDQQWQDSNSRRYVSYDMTGYEELDRYGTWSQDADYGAIWYPTRIAAGWAPYRDGHWTYVRPWGWTWVDDAPWGYAPSHYGRWVQVRNRWGWIPGGGARERPVWAPAVVGFIGGAGFSIGVSSSPVGWYPLAPWERYDPWYRASPTYVTRVNRHVVDRAPRWWQGRGDDWRRWNHDRAATVVNRDAFVNRRRVQDSIVRVNPDAMRQAPVASSAQVAQQVLPQRNEVLRFREQNRVEVAAPVVTPQRRVWNERREAAPQAQVQPQAQPQQQAGQVVRPDFRRRANAPVAVTPAPAAGQPPVAAPAPQFQQPPQNPTARVDRAQQRQAEEAAQRAQQEQAQRAAREAQQQQERAARDNQQQQQRQAREAQQAQERAQREAQRQQQEQAQRAQQEQAQRAQQEQAQRAAREAQQQQERAARDNQQQQQRQAREAQQAQERAQREAQQQQQQLQQQQQQQAAELQRRREEAAQRAARDTQAREQAFRQQQEAAQRAQQQQLQQQQQQQQQAQERARQQQQQAQERAQRAQPQPAPPPQPAQAQPQAQPQPQPAPQANPAARGDNRGRGRDKEKEDKDKEEKDKKDKR